MKQKMHRLPHRLMGGGVKSTPQDPPWSRTSLTDCAPPFRRIFTEFASSAQKNRKSSSSATGSLLSVTLWSRLMRLKV